MTLEELKAGMLKRPKDFAYYGELDLSVWGFAPFGMHRDSDLLTQSNFAFVVRELRRVSGKSVEVMHTSHWAVGWYDHVMVRTTAPKTMEKLLELYERHDNYPVLDEEDLWEREREQADGAYETWAKWDVGKLVEAAGIEPLLDSDGDYDPKPEDEETVAATVSRAILDHDSGEGTFDDTDLVGMLREAFAPPPPPPHPAFDF
jgi:hypothetical protein